MTPAATVLATIRPGAFATTAEVATALGCADYAAEMVCAMLALDGQLARVGQGWSLNVAPQPQGTSPAAISASPATHLVGNAGGRL